MAGASWAFGTASRHLKGFCGVAVSGEFIRNVSRAAGKKLTAWMDQSPAAVAPFHRAKGDVEFETDATTVNTTAGWKDAKIGIFAKRERGESVETKQWDDRKLPAPTARFAFARIAECHDFAANWGATAKRLGIDPRSGTLTTLGDGAAWIWDRAAEQFPGSPGKVIFQSSPVQLMAWGW